jgi:arsenite methyltransferase
MPAFSKIRAVTRGRNRSKWSFTRRFANHAGRVLAIDIDAKLLGKVKASGLKNVTPILATADDPQLKPATVDTIFICDVWHHIENRPAYLKKLRNALKPGGRIVIIDFHKRELPVGPPPSMKIDAAELVSEFAKADLTVHREHTFLPYQYFFEFRATRN